MQILKLVSDYCIRPSNGQVWDPMFFTMLFFFLVGLETLAFRISVPWQLTVGNTWQNFHISGSYSTCLRSPRGFADDANARALWKPSKLRFLGSTTHAL